MNIALVALTTDQKPAPPPLTLAYIAAVLEQQRHIVRVYDLALTSIVNSTQATRLLRAFRPQLVIVAGERQDLLAAAVGDLRKQHASVFGLPISRDADSATRACEDALTWIEQQRQNQNNKNVISVEARAIASLSSINALPLPARHLLALEQYGLRASGGELQTTLSIGQPSRDSCGYELRCVAPIVNELRAVSREHGLRHYRLCGAPLSFDNDWLREFLHGLIAADLGIAWEGVVQLEELDCALLALMRQAGCEALRLTFDVSEMLESAEARAAFKQTIMLVRQQGIYALAELSLEPPYDSIPQVVDVAATFGLDGVVFQVPASRLPQQREAERIQAIAQQRYSVGRSKQHYIDRYGDRLGSIVWSVRQSRLGSHFWGDDDDDETFGTRGDMASAA